MERILPFAVQHGTEISKSDYGLALLSFHAVWGSAELAVSGNNVDASVLLCMQAGGQDQPKGDAVT